MKLLILIELLLEHRTERFTFKESPPMPIESAHPGLPGDEFCIDHFTAIYIYVCSCDRRSKGYRFALGNENLKGQPSVSVGNHRWFLRGYRVFAADVLGVAGWKPASQIVVWAAWKLRSHRESTESLD
jgi:hypothetical protein